MGVSLFSQDFLSFFPNERNVHATPDDAEAFEEITLDGSEDEDDRVGEYLPDENGLVWDYVELEMEEKDRIHGSRKCPCRCHVDPEASQPFQNTLRHCVTCAKIIVNGRWVFDEGASRGITSLMYYGTRAPGFPHLD